MQYVTKVAYQKSNFNYLFAAHDFTSVSHPELSQNSPENKKKKPRVILAINMTWLKSLWPFVNREKRLRRVGKEQVGHS